MAPKLLKAYFDTTCASFQTKLPESMQDAAVYSDAFAENMSTFSETDVGWNGLGGFVEGWRPDFTMLVVDIYERIRDLNLLAPTSPRMKF